MKGFFIDFLLYAAKTLGSKFIDRLIDRLDGGKLVFTKVKGGIYYSHYIGQNHVRDCGERKIFQAQASLTVFNPGKAARVLRELTLHCMVDGSDFLFHLYDTHLEIWEENYQLQPKHVCGFAWQAAPEGHGLTVQCGANGIIPINDLNTVSLYITYLDEHGRHHWISMDSITTYRLPKEQIAE